MKRRSAPTFVVAAVVWALVIFGTSCTFISRRVFIQFIRQFIPPGIMQQAWASLWSGCGIFIVKGYHIAEFTLLCFLLFSGLRRSLCRDARAAVAISAAFSVLYAISDEWHQTFVIGRGGTAVDVGIDCIGIFVMTACILWWHRSKPDSERRGLFWRPLRRDRR